MHREAKPRARVVDRDSVSDAGGIRYQICLEPKKPRNIFVTLASHHSRKLPAAGRANPQRALLYDTVSEHVESIRVVLQRLCIRIIVVSTSSAQCVCSGLLFVVHVQAVLESLDRHVIIKTSQKIPKTYLTSPPEASFQEALSAQTHPER